MVNRISSSFCFIFLFLSSFQVIAQKDIYISNITAELGFNYNRVNSIAQDSAGLIWFGLFGKGLATYDGRSIRRVVLKGEDRFANSKQMFVTDSKYLYLNCSHGVEIFDPILEKVIDTIAHKESALNNLGFDKIELKIHESDTLIWALSYGDNNMEVFSYSGIIVEGSYRVYLSTNGGPFKPVGDEKIECDGNPILIPFKDKAILKSKQYLQTLNTEGNVEIHAIPNVSLKDLYNSNIVLDDANLWISDQITCRPKVKVDITEVNYLENEAEVVLVKYNLTSKTFQSVVIQSDAKCKEDLKMGRLFLLFKDKNNINYNLNYSISLDHNRVDAYNNSLGNNPIGSGPSTVYEYLKDNTGVLWVAGDFGLIKVIQKNEAFDLIPNLGLRSFVEGTDGKVYGHIKHYMFGKKENDDGFDRLSVYNPEDGTLIYRKIKFNKGDQTIFSPSIQWMKTAYKNDQIYTANKKINTKDAIATELGNFDPFKSSAISVLGDSKGRLWKAAWYTENVQVYDWNTNEMLREDTLPEFKYTPVEINDMYERPSTGNIWLGSNGKGLYILPSEKGEILHITRSEKSKIKLLNNIVSGFYEDTAKNMWIGHENGLSKISENLDAVEHFPYDPYLKEPRFIYSILPDDDKNFLWLSSDQGIYRFDIEKGEYIGFPLDPVVMNSEYNRNSFLKTSEGTMVFGGIIDGARTVTFIPSEVIEKYEKAAIVKVPIVLSSLTKYSGKGKKEIKIDKGLQRVKQIVLHPGDRFFELDFSIADYRISDAHYFTYFLEGYDQNERKPSTQNYKVRYENLDPGTYQLVLKGGFSHQALERNQRTIEVRVLPNWYETIWAKLIFGILCVGLLYILYKYKMRQQFEKQETIRIKELESLKTRLYTNITHEFRTPLTVILGMNDNISGHQEEKSLIRRNAKNLLQLINQLLNLSKLDAGKLKVNEKKGDVVGFVHYLTESFYSMASERKIDLSFNCNIDRYTAKYDETKIQHIVYNLISNAIKFTRPGGKVAVDMEIPSGNDETYFSIYVKDTGVGIDEDHLPHIFERFYQIADSSSSEDKNGSSSFEGTGIGLAFVKELVDLMNGKITVKSKKLWGTEFIILLPLPEIESMFQANQFKGLHTSNEVEVDYNSLPAKPDQMSVDKPILLVIEDNIGVITYIKSILTPIYTVEVAMNGLEGIEQAKEIIPDIILSDVMMPERNGFEVVKELKNNQKTSHIPIIMLTAKTDLASKIMGFEFGADAYLSKPFEKEELLVRVKNLLLLREKLQSYYRGNLPKIPLDVTSSSRDNAFIESVKSLVLSNMGDSNFSVSAIPKHVCMSTTQFHRKLKALTGQTPVVFVRTIRMQKALQLLEETDMSISEIAYETGFSDPNYFTRVFKKAIGRVPGSFRK